MIFLLSGFLFVNGFIHGVFQQVKPLSLSKLHAKEKSNSSIRAESDGCPFSISNVRNNRISLSRIKANDSAFKRNWLTKSFDTLRVENSYKNIPNLKLQNLEEELRNLKDTELTLLKSNALFWRAVSDLLSSNEYSKLAFAMPGITNIVAVQFVEILEWWNQHGNSSSSNFVKPYVDSKSPEYIPVIVLERIPNVSASSPSNDSDCSGLDIDVALVEGRTKAWVTRILVDLGICPFTKSDVESGQGAGGGIPVAKIAYHCSSAKKSLVESLMADW